MNRWIVTALVGALSLAACLATLSCKEGDADRGDTEGIEIVFIDPEEQARLAELARKNYDYEDELASFFEADPHVAEWRPSGEATSRPGSWFATEEAAGMPRAEAYAASDVLAMRSQTFEREDRPGETLELRIVRTRTLLDAFGLYASQRHPAFDYSTRGLGNQGYVDQSTLRMWHSRWIVTATIAGAPDGAAERVREDLLAVGIDLSTRFEELSRPILPRHLRLFPGTDIIANSQRYDRTPLLGIEGAPRAITVEFARPEGILTGFFLECETTEEAGSTFDLLTAHFQDADAMLDEYLGFGAESFRAEVEGHGKGIFFLHREFIGGLYDLQGDAMPTDLLQGFVNNVDSLFPNDEEILRLHRERAEERAAENAAENAAESGDATTGDDGLRGLFGGGGSDAGTDDE